MKAKHWTAIMVAVGIAWSGWTTAPSAFGSETDDRIEAAMKNSYVYRTYLKDDDVRIDSKDGVVTLTGKVHNPAHKSLAEDTAKGLPGVKNVLNRIAVAGPKSDTMSDEWISAKVKAALLFHRSASGKTQVYVQNGVVTLKGAANSQSQKDLTTEYARDVDGVKDVVNEMTIVTTGEPEPTLGEKIDDASITAQVKYALLTYRSTSALRTDVDTKDGAVTIKGTAKNQAEIDLVTKLAKDIKGVESVKNEMTVAK